MNIKYIQKGLFFLLLMSMLGSIYAFNAGFYNDGALEIENVKRIARVTGKSLPGENLPNPNHTDERFDIGGTDLGIAWVMGNGKVGFFFGDTYGKDFKVVNEGGPGKAGNWRSNVLGISSDGDLQDGITFEKMVAHQIIPSPHITNGTGSHTTIPTAAINAGGVDYVHYMDVRKWGEHANWTTNYSGIYRSVDNGLHWKKCDQIRFDALSNFAQVAYAKKNGFVYMMGTVPGRWGAAHLARFKEADILDQKAYQYWNSAKGWVVNDEKSADPVIEAPLGEVSLAYNKKFDRWIISYLNEKKRELVFRDAKNVTGPWSTEKTLAKANDYPGLYGAFMHPANENSDDFYFLMSMWGPYNVFLMKAQMKLSE